MALISSALAATTLGSASYASAFFPLLDLGYYLEDVTIADLKAMKGKHVLDKNRELIGHVGKVDDQAKLVELKTPKGAIVSISVDSLVKDGAMLAAPSLVRGDIVAMIDRPGEPSIRVAETSRVP